MPMNGHPEISVVIPVYNGEKFVRDTVESLICQSFLDFEIICVDDGSTDGSALILRELASIEARLRVYSKVNGGNATQAVRFGIERAYGKYFMYASQDDLFSKDLLQKSHQRAEQCKADAVVPNMEYYWAQGRPAGAPVGIRGVNGDVTPELSGAEAFALSLDWTIHGFALWSMDLVKRIGFYDYGLSSDEYSTRMFFYHSNKVVFSNGTFYYRQDNPQAITQKWNIKHLGYLETAIRLEQFVVHNGLDPQMIPKIHASLLTELVRIERLYSANRHLIPAMERVVIRSQLRTAYRDNRDRIASSRVSGLRMQMQKSMSSTSYSTFKLWCLLLSIGANAKARIGRLLV